MNTKAKASTVNVCARTICMWDVMASYGVWRMAWLHACVHVTAPWHCSAPVLLHLLFVATVSTITKPCRLLRHPGQLCVAVVVGSVCSPRQQPPPPPIPPPPPQPINPPRVEWKDKIHVIFWLRVVYRERPCGLCFSFLRSFLLKKNTHTHIWLLRFFLVV